MSASVQRLEVTAQPAAARLAKLNRLDAVGLLITLLTLVGAVIWAFPLYWGLITTFKHEYEIVRPGFQAAKFHGHVALAEWPSVTTGVRDNS